MVLSNLKSRTSIGRYELRRKHKCSFKVFVETFGSGEVREGGCHEGRRQQYVQWVGGRGTGEKVVPSVRQPVVSAVIKVVAIKMK